MESGILVINIGEGLGKDNTAEVVHVGNKVAQFIYGPSVSLVEATKEIGEYVSENVITEIVLTGSVSGWLVKEAFAKDFPDIKITNAKNVKYHNS